MVRDCLFCDDNDAEMLLHNASMMPDWAISRELGYPKVLLTTVIFTMGDLRIFGLLEILMSEFWANKFCPLLSLLFSERFINCYIAYSMCDIVPESIFLFYGFNMP